MARCRTCGKYQRGVGKFHCWEKQQCRYCHYLGAVNGNYITCMVKAK